MSIWVRWKWWPRVRSCVGPLPSAGQRQVILSIIVAVVVAIITVVVLKLLNVGNAGTAGGAAAGGAAGAVVGWLAAGKKTKE